MKPKCIFIDHDDTAVDSTPPIHYQAHLKVMKLMRPKVIPLSLDGWFKVNFDPGIGDYFKNNLKMSPSEIIEEYGIWREFSSTIIPKFFPGFIDILVRYRNFGGKVVVVSHSETEFIERDYRTTGFMPDMIFGWTNDEATRKPSPLPINTALNHFGIDPKESLIIDDLKPGVIMGQNAGVPVAAAAWSHSIPEIRKYMEKHCVAYLRTVKELETFLLS